MKSETESKLTRSERRRKEWLMERKKIHMGKKFLLLRRGDEMAIFGLLDKQELEWMKESSQSQESKTA